MELGDHRLSLSRVTSALDEAVMEFTAVLDSVGVEYVIVSGYVVILTGRSRATEDIDVILEPLTDDRVDELIDALTDHGYYGMAMPFDEVPAMLGEGERVRIAEEGQLYPNFEVWFASNDVERVALEDALTAELDDHQLQISPTSCSSPTNSNSPNGWGASKGRISKTPCISISLRRTIEYSGARTIHRRTRRPGLL